jgi:hypothetical protein
MSALVGALTVTGALVLEEILFSSSNAPSALGGIFGTIDTVISKISDPNVAAIPNRAK